jgi:hypothetical protein
MKRKTSLNLLYVFVLMLATACISLPPGGDATSTATLMTEPVPTDELSPTPTQPTQSQQQFIAYVQNGQLLVTNVTNGVGRTTQYTQAKDQVSRHVWSPPVNSCSSPRQRASHIFTSMD